VPAEAFRPAELEKYSMLGDIVQGWTPRPRPQHRVFEGRYVRLEPLDAEHHARALFDALAAGDPEGRLWTYMYDGPFDSFDSYRAHLARQAASDDPLFYAIGERASGAPVGVASLMRIVPEHGVIEVGHILYTPGLQRTPGATEAMALLAGHVFDDLGYRRYEWKCNALNGPSRRAAQRLGFTYEGMFRQHLVVKGRNRDTAWFAMLDYQWPTMRAAFEAWLAPENFDGDGRQKRTLEEIRSAL
jgi:RimJ/RimL family protein N-acetyltransferase